MKEKANRKTVFGWGLTTLTAVTLLGASLFTLTGCNQNPAIEKEFNHTAALDLLTNADAAHEQSLDANGATLASGSGSSCVSEDIGSEGGSLTLTVGGHVITFNVPQKALDSNVVITICGWSDVQPDGEVFVYECQPSGLQFDEPMWVKHPVGVEGVENSVLFYQGDNSSNWTFEDFEDVSGGTALFEIYHFSGYGVSNRRVGW